MRVTSSFSTQSGLLGMVLVLIIASTSYDIFCTFNRRKWSSCLSIVTDQLFQFSKM